MKGFDLAVHDESHSGTRAFHDLASHANQQALDIRPGDTRRDWVLEDSLQRPDVLTVHAIDITSDQRECKRITLAERAPSVSRLWRAAKELPAGNRISQAPILPTSEAPS
jgi:hypothetical protein